MQWSLPPHIVAFLSNYISSLPQKLQLIPWPEFKKIIFDIIDHRIEWAWEINGAINNSYVSLDEHLVAYWVNFFLVDKFSIKDGKQGTRD